MAAGDASEQSAGSAAPVTKQDGPCCDSDCTAELMQLRDEYQALETAEAELEAERGIAAHDARLERLRLTSHLRWLWEGKPGLKEIADRYESELEALEEEVLRLREENARAALPSLGAAGGASAQPCSGGASVATATGEAQQHAPEAGAAAGGGPRSAAEELWQEVTRLRGLRREHRRRIRQTRLEEWQLGVCRAETKTVAKRLELQERRLEEFQQRHDQSEGYLRDIREKLVQCRQDSEQERATIQVLHREAVSLREACYLPVRLKRESNFLMKLFHQEGGRLQTQRRLKGLELCQRLYDEVASVAPSLQPTAGRAKADMEIELARYLHLEEAHSLILQRLHLSVTRGLLQQGPGLQQAFAS